MGRLAVCVNETQQQVAESLSQAGTRSLATGRGLLAAKEICGKGKFGAWLKADFAFSSSTTRGYMRFIAKWNELGLDLRRAGCLDPGRAANATQRHADNPPVAIGAAWSIIGRQSVRQGAGHRFAGRAG